jgi:hypothetical protein
MTAPFSPVSLASTQQQQHTVASNAFGKMYSGISSPASPYR